MTAPSRRHGLGVDGVAALLARQQGRCAICGVLDTGMPGTRLAIDHDHKHCPGKKGCPVCIRGALCNACNNGLRVFHDDVTLLYRAIDYLNVKRLM